MIILTFHFGVGVNAQNTPLVTALTAMLHRYLTVNTHVSTDHKITARLLESTCIVCQSFQFSPKVRDAGILRNNECTCLFQIQLLGYNSDLYGNVSQALASSNGLAIIALLGQVSRSQLMTFIGGDTV